MHVSLGDTGVRQLCGARGFDPEASFRPASHRKALCPSPRFSRACMRSRAARSLRSVTQRSNSSSRTSMSPKKRKPCRAEEPHGIRENRSSIHFRPSKPPEVRQGFQWSVKPRTRTRPVGHWRAGLAESGIRENASNTTSTLNVTSPDSPFTSVRSTSHDRMIGRRLLDCGCDIDKAGLLGGYSVDRNNDGSSGGNCGEGSSPYPQPPGVVRSTRNGGKSEQWHYSC